MRKTTIIFLLTALLTTYAHAEDETMDIRRNALKITFLSWFTGSVKLFYERSVFEHQAVEGAVGIIGVMHDGKHNNPKGWLVRYAHQFNLFLTNEQKPLQGLFIKPEVAMSTFRYDPKDGSSRTRSTICAVMAQFGYQHVFGRFIIDGYWGIGPCFGKVCDTYYEHGVLLWDFFGHKNKNIATSAGMRVGFVF